MLFNSFEFLIFFLVVFTLYWGMNCHLRLQNWLLFMGSYVFYGWWNWSFLSLIFLSTLVDFYIGGKLYQLDKERLRKMWLAFSIVFNLGLLCYFKYSNFFIESFVEAFGSLGVELNVSTLRIILPVGISFYTFQTMSYSLDIYHRKIKPTDDFIAFAAFVSFFPQLVAGPIERASHLLPQISKPRKFNYEQALDGVRLMLWGFFKKVVIADNLAPVVNDIFNNYQDHSGGTLVLGAVFFAFQIYGDFSGYSDIAIGVSKLFGVELTSNFKFPYFSRSIAEFWRRWHTSLSTWFRDYLYIPLGGSRLGKWFSLRNVMIIFLVSGFWHGANWTFIIWGGIHGLLFVPLLLLNMNRKHVSDVVAENSLLPSIREMLQMSSTFILVLFAWIFFRAESVGLAVDYISRLTISSAAYKTELFYPIVLIALEWTMRKNERKPFERLPSFWVMLGLSLAILFFRHQDLDNVEFIYFQF